jgi:hypothetical protein
MLTAGDASHFNTISLLSEQMQNQNNLDETNTEKFTETFENLNMLFWLKNEGHGQVQDMRDCVKGIVLEGVLPVGAYLYHISPFLKRGFPDGDIAFYSLNVKDLRSFFSPYLAHRYPGQKQKIHRYKVTRPLRVLFLHPGFTSFDWAEAHMYESDVDEFADDIEYRDDIFREIGRRGEYDAIFTIQNLEIDIMNELILFDRVKGNKVVWDPCIIRS